MGAVTGGKKSVLVNLDCSIAYLIESSLLLIKCLLSPKKVLIETTTGLWRKAEGGARPGAENNEPAGLGTEIEDK